MDRRAAARDRALKRRAAAARSTTRARLVGGDDVETCVSHDVLGRLMLMSAREPGLASVYGEVLGFGGDEFYLKARRVSARIGGDDDDDDDDAP